MPTYDKTKTEKLKKKAKAAGFASLDQVEQFQRAYGIEADQDVGTDTKRKLVEARNTYGKNLTIPQLIAKKNNSSRVKTAIKTHSNKQKQERVRLIKSDWEEGLHKLSTAPSDNTRNTKAVQIAERKAASVRQKQQEEKARSERTAKVQKIIETQQQVPEALTSQWDLNNIINQQYSFPTSVEELNAQQDQNYIDLIRSLDPVFTSNKSDEEILKERDQIAKEQKNKRIQRSIYNYETPTAWTSFKNNILSSRFFDIVPNAITFFLDRPYRGSEEKARSLGYKNYYDSETGIGGQVSYPLNIDLTNKTYPEIMQAYLDTYGITPDHIKDKSTWSKHAYKYLPNYSYDITSYLYNVLNGITISDPETGRSTGEKGGTYIDYDKIQGGDKLSGIEPDRPASSLREDQRNLAFSYPMVNNTMRISDEAVNFRGRPWESGYAFTYVNDSGGGLQIPHYKIPEDYNEAKSIASIVLSQIDKDPPEGWSAPQDILNREKVSAYDLQPEEQVLVQDYGLGAGGRGKYTVGKTKEGTPYTYDFWNFPLFNLLGATKGFPIIVTDKENKEDKK